VTTVLVVAHTGRPEAAAVARDAVRRLIEAGATVRLLEGEAEVVGSDGAQVHAAASAGPGADLVLVLGGDGTILRAAELVRGTGTPLLGVNLGHMGFLAEIEPDRLDHTVEHLLRGSYDVEERMTVDVVVRSDGVEWSAWALNEVSVEKANRERMVELVAEVDGRPLSRYGADGLVVATPTGSTAYAFSSGGPVVAPDVEALLVVPISAHALFSRPLVVGPRSTVAVEVLAPTPAVLFCDGRRTRRLPPGSRVEVRRGAEPVRLARIHPATFTERLVRKFDLPVEGWRGRS
jgi:NAD+ kinase